MESSNDVMYYKPQLAVLEGVDGFWNEGGTLYSLISWLSSTLAQATAWIVNWSHDSLPSELGHGDTEKVLYFYVQGLNNGDVPRFQGMSDPNLTSLVSYLIAKTGLTENVVYNAMYGLWLGANQGNKSCASIISGSGTTPLDTLHFESPAAAAQKTVSDVLESLSKMLGLDPSTLKTIVYVVGAAAALVLLFNLYRATQGQKGIRIERTGGRPWLQWSEA